MNTRNLSSVFLCAEICNGLYNDVLGNIHFRQEKLLVSWTKTEINEYLFYEFGVDTEYNEDEIHPPITENWPFQLKEVGTVKVNQLESPVFQFEDEPGGENC